MKLDGFPCRITQRIAAKLLGSEPAQFEVMGIIRIVPTLR